MPSIPLKHKCLSIILIGVIVSHNKEKVNKKNLFLISLFGKKGHGIGGKGAYFGLGMGPKFGP